MDGFKRRRQKKELKILETALELFSAHGMQKDSVAEIARGANVSQVTIYNYFGSKDELIKRSAEKFMNDRFASFEETLQSDLTFPQKLEQIIFEKTEATKNMDMGLIRKMLSDDPSMREFIENIYRQRTLPTLVRLLDQGRAEGYIDPNISNEAIMIYVSIFKNGMDESTAQIVHNSKLLMEIGNLFFFGIIGRAPSPPHD